LEAEIAPRCVWLYFLKLQKELNMSAFKIETANLSIQYRFAQMPPQIPLPGTPSFGILVRGLRPFGLNARGVSVEGSSSELEQLIVELRLLGNIARIRIGFSGIDIFANNPEAEDALRLLSIMGVVFEAFKSLDSDATQGTTNVRIILQTALSGITIEDYLRGKVSDTIDTSKLIPDAVSFRLNIDEITRMAQTRVILAKSVPIENGLYVEINYEGGSAAIGADPLEFLKGLEAHYASIFSFVGLDQVKE
jgi:hypothetical protein